MPNGPSGTVPDDYRHHGTRTGSHDSHVIYFRQSQKWASVNFDLVLPARLQPGPLPVLQMRPADTAQHGPCRQSTLGLGG